MSSSVEPAGASIIDILIECVILGGVGQLIFMLNKLRPNSDLRQARKRSDDSEKWKAPKTTPAAKNETNCPQPD